MARAVKDIKERFEALFIPEPNTGCWLWLGSVRSKDDPYGRIFIGRRGNGGKSVKAHRLSYFLAKGPIPAGHFVCHKCDNRNCVNPDHLFTAPQGLNIRDAVRKSRLNPLRRKLSFRDAQDIRAQYQWYHPENGMGGLARRYGVTTGTINNILNGRSYRPSTFAVTTEQEIAEQSASQSDTGPDTSLPAREADESAAPISHSSADPLPSVTDTAGEVTPPQVASPVAPFDDGIPAFLKTDKPGCLKLKDGHCKISCPTEAICSECESKRARERA